MMNPRRVVFRVDSSLDMGTGHVMRCLTLANSLRHKGFETYFLCRTHSGHSINSINQQGHLVMPLCDVESHSMVEYTDTEQLTHASWLGCSIASDANQTSQLLEKLQPEWLVVDHYALDYRWESMQRPYVGKILAIDDLADRSHDADLLLDQNLGRTPQDYCNLLPANASKLLGPTYALLRPEFALLREASILRRTSSTEIKRILISMGGIDKDNATGAVLVALAKAGLPKDTQIIVIMGANAPWLQQVQDIATNLIYTVKVEINTHQMAQLMADSDLAIGAAGSTSWERCCLGLPTMLVVLADNQKPIAEALHKYGAADRISLLRPDLDEYIENSLKIDSNYIKCTIPSMIKNSILIADGRGTDRIVEAMTRQ